MFITSAHIIYKEIGNYERVTKKLQLAWKLQSPFEIELHNHQNEIHPKMAYELLKHENCFFPPYDDHLNLVTKSEIHSSKTSFKKQGVKKIIV